MENGAGGGGLRMELWSPLRDGGRGVGVGFGHGVVIGGLVNRPSAPGSRDIVTSGYTYSVSWLVNPPPAGIATVDGNGEGGGFGDT